MYGLYGTVNLKVGASDLPSPVKKFDLNEKEVGQKRNKVKQGEAHNTQIHTNHICGTSKKRGSSKR